MKWKEHDRWATKLNILTEVSREVNTIIDSIEQGKDIPKEYRRYLRGCANSVRENTSGSAFGMVAADYAARRHDVSRGKKTGDRLSAEIHKCALLKMGKPYIVAWYLHHHLDVIDENRGSGKTLEEICSQHKQEAPQTYSKTIAAFLRKHKDELEAVK